MSAEGTGAEISADDADDLLHKLITESIKVQAVFVGPYSLLATSIGFVRQRPDGTVFVLAGDGKTMGSNVSFDPRQATSWRYGDSRAFSGGASHMDSALIFVYPGGGQLALQG